MTYYFAKKLKCNIHEAYNQVIEKLNPQNQQ
jgi:hypothetical protein